MKTVACSLIVLVALASAEAPALADCQCLANGKTFHHGEVACLSLPTGKLLARCDMVLNNSSWQKLQDGCPEAAADAAQIKAPPDAHDIPQAPPRADTATF